MHIPENISLASVHFLQFATLSNDLHYKHGITLKITLIGRGMRKLCCAYIQIK